MSIHERIQRALTATRALNIPDEEVRPELKKLYRVYRNWDFIEAEDYRVLIDAYFDSKESREGVVDDGNDELEHDGKQKCHTSLTKNDSSQSFPNGEGKVLTSKEEQKPTVSSKPTGSISIPREGESGSASTLPLTKSMDKRKEIIPPRVIKQNVSGKLLTGQSMHSNKELTIDNHTQEHKHSSVVDRVSLSSKIPRLTEGSSTSSRKHIAKLVSQNGAGCSEGRSIHNFVIATSTQGEVKICVNCDAALDPNFRVPNFDEVLNRLKDEYLSSSKLVQPQFSPRNFLKDLGNCLLKPGTVSFHQENSSHGVPPNPAPHKNTSGIGNSEMESSNLENVPQKSVNDGSTRDFPGINDITKGAEKVRISLKNDSGSEEGLPKFCYIPCNIIYQNAYLHISLARIADDDCCSSCLGDCLSSQIPCECTRETGGEFAYTPQGVLKADFLSSCMSMKRNPERHVLVYCEDCPFERSRNEPTPEACRGHLVRKFIKECWRKCGCDMLCGNRVVQRGITCNLQVFWTPEGKGWGLRTLKDLPKGTFVCEYVGEILTNTELYERNLNNTGNERHTYPVTLDADWGSEKMLRDEEALCLDATYSGNVARFINHRCIDANLIDIPVEVETPDRHYYHLAFFTTREVKAMEELSWDYGIDFSDHNHPIKAFKCNCGSKLCQYADEEEVKKRRRQSLLEAAKGKRIKTTAKKEKPGLV